MRTVISVGILLVVVGAGIATFLYSGIYNVAATDEHTRPVTWLFRTALVNSVERHADGIVSPDNLDDPEFAAQAFGHYDGACVTCHGGPGVKPAPWMELNPNAPDLTNIAERWSDSELFWIVKNGIKMTGMPALGPSHGDDDLWAIVAFLKRLPTISAEEYAAMKEAYGPGMGGS